jgi:hypothetical protein
MELSQNPGPDRAGRYNHKSRVFKKASLIVKEPIAGFYQQVQIIIQRHSKTLKILFFIVASTQVLGARKTITVWKNRKTVFLKSLKILYHFSKKDASSNFLKKPKNRPCNYLKILIKKMAKMGFFQNL